MKSFFVVLRKELLDCFRDKRSLVMMILPLFIFPLLLNIYNRQIASADENLSKQIILATNDESKIKEIAEIISLNGIDVVIIVTKDAATELKSGQVSLIVNKDKDGFHVIYDPNSIKSTKAVGIVSAAIESAKASMLHDVLTVHGESIDILSAYHYVCEDVATITDNDNQNSMISVIGPMLIVMFIATGGSGIALDLFCGEKERGSLESLLATKISRKALYFTKTVTVFLFVCLSTLISVGGYLISFALDEGFDGIGMSVHQVLLFFIVTGVFAFFTASIISMLSLSAKTVKEGSLRINLFTLLPTIIGGAAMYIETGNISTATNFIPIINTLNALKAVFSGTTIATHFIITIVSTTIYGLFFLLIGYALMSSEKVISK